MKKLLASFALLMMMASVLVPVGIGYAQGKVELHIAAGELKVWDDWSITPAKWSYEGQGEATARIIVFNKGNTAADFDMGDGHILTVPPNSQSDIYTYHDYLYLAGQTVRFTITKLNDDGSGVRIQEALVLKIEPT